VDTPTRHAPRCPNTARAALSDLPDNEYRSALENVVDFCVERAY